MIRFDEVEQKYYSTLMHSIHGSLTRKGTQNLPAVFSKATHYWVRQVHSNIVLSVNDQRDPGLVTTKEADALVYKKDRKDKVILSVRTADCVPIILEDRKHQIIAVAHSGWKGCLKNIAGNCVNKMTEVGAEISDIRVYIGPSIGSCCYSVGPELLKLFDRSYKDCFENREGAVKLNLRKMVMQQLLEVGVLREHIDTQITCTECQSSVLTSFRREGKGVVNMLSYISL